MYFKESDRLAEARPGLRTVVELVDKLLVGVPSDGVFTLSPILARLPGQDAHQVRETLAGLVQQGALKSAVELICAQCETSNDPSREECSQCACELGSAKRETVYSLVGTPTEPTTRSRPMPAVGRDGRPEPSVAIITALPTEYAAVQHILDLDAEWVAQGVGAGLRYQYGAVHSSNGGKHTVVATLQVAIGNNSAATRATQVLSHFPSVPHIVMCGIAGGVRDPSGGTEGDVRLGDVVISDKMGVVQYDFGRIRENEFEVQHSPRPPSAQLLEAVLYLATTGLRGVKPWEAYLKAAAEAAAFTTRPADTAGAKAGTIVAYPFDPNRTQGMPRVFLGPIGSANAVLRDAVARERLRGRFGLKAVEMEGSGVADATWIAEVGYLVVRGVADFCDGEKGNEWHGAAASSAACVLRALLESMPAPRHSH